ncbi:MAG: helix-turn-helix domain-containing protein [Anaerolineae bacterium]|nr:helix-turn-helix domain-containing protein [Anaerolineae bacterium]
MKTLTLTEAAAFLKLHPEELRARAKAGQIPGAKAGRRWVFIEDDLASYLRSLYAPNRQALQVSSKGISTWHFSNAARRGGLISPRQQESELDKLLKQRTGTKPRSTTTS